MRRILNIDLLQLRKALWGLRIRCFKNHLIISGTHSNPPTDLRYPGLTTDRSQSESFILTLWGWREKKWGWVRQGGWGLLAEMMEKCWANTEDKWVLTFIWKMKTVCLLKQRVCFYETMKGSHGFFFFYLAYKKTQLNFMLDFSLSPQIWFGANYSFLTIPLTPTQNEAAVPGCGLASYAFWEMDRS